MLNRKGHIGTMLMFFGALVLVVTALFTFSSYSDKMEVVEGTFRELSAEFRIDEKLVQGYLKDMVNDGIREVNNAGADDFEEAFNVSLKKSSEELRGKGLDTNLFGKIINGNYFFNDLEGSYELELKDVFARVEEENNEIRRVFDLSVKFDREKILEFVVE